MNKENLKAIEKYYKKSRLWLPKKSFWRIWKFKLADGRMIQIKDKIRDKKTFRKHLLRWLPVDVYYSSGCFLEPEKVRGTKTSNHLLFRNIVFDIDVEDNWDTARLTAINLIRDIRERFDKEPLYILLTGGKGLHVVYEFNSFSPDIVYKLKFIGIDQEITLDEYRVIRCPLTIHNKGKLAVFLKYKDLLNLDTMLKKSKTIYSPNDNGVGAGKPKRLMTNFFPPKVNNEKSATAPPDSHTFKCITNEVIAEDRKMYNPQKFIPILRYNTNGIKFNPREDIRRISEKYGLREWFVIRAGWDLFFISLVAVERRRLIKILNSSKSDSKNDFKKLNKVFMRVTPINGYLDRPQKVDILCFTDIQEKQFQYSKAHMNYIKFAFNYAPNPFLNYIGHDRPTLIIDTFKKLQGGVKNG